MRKALLIIAATVFTLAACEKDPKTPKTDTTAQFDSSYIVNGVVDIKMDNADRASIALAISHVSGTQKQITLTLIGLPERTTAELMPASGTAPFGTELTINTNFTAPGTYALKLVATPENGTTNEYEFNLTVEGKNECKKYFHSGVKNGFDVYPPGSNFAFEFSSDILFYFEQTDSLFIMATLPMREPVSQQGPTTFLHWNEFVSLNVDCTDGNITIPAQTVEGMHPQTGDETFTISGTGKLLISEKKFEIKYDAYAQRDNITTTYTIKGAFTP